MLGPGKTRLPVDLGTPRVYSKDLPLTDQRKVALFAGLTHAQVFCMICASVTDIQSRTCYTSVSLA